jgi:hypothetical protein
MLQTNTNTYVEKAIEKIGPNLKELAKSCYHAGRHDERNKLANSGYLIINPEKEEQLKKDCNDPCTICEFHEKDHKMGCSVNPTNCALKKKQFLAIEIEQYFKKNE